MNPITGIMKVPPPTPNTRPPVNGESFHETRITRHATRITHHATRITQHASLLMPDLISTDFQYFESLESTNLYCMSEADNLASGTVVVADSQSAGRGRHGRTWLSPAGVNLYTSIIFKRPVIEKNVLLLTQIASLSVWNRISALGVQNAWIKWPNDVYVEDRKVAGMLCECKTLGNDTEAFVIGIGVNLNMDRTAVQSIDQPATSIFLETRNLVDRDDFLLSVADRFTRYYDEYQISGHDRIHQLWRSASGLIDRAVVISLDNGNTIRGTVIDFLKDGAISIRTETGERRKFISGDVSLRVTCEDG